MALGPSGLWEGQEPDVRVLCSACGVPFGYGRRYWEGRLDRVAACCSAACWEEFWRRHEDARLARVCWQDALWRGELAARPGPHVVRCGVCGAEFDFERRHGDCVPCCSSRCRRSYVGWCDSLRDLVAWGEGLRAARRGEEAAREEREERERWAPLRAYWRDMDIRHGINRQRREMPKPWHDPYGHGLPISWPHVSDDD